MKDNEIILNSYFDSPSEKMEATNQRFNFHSNQFKTSFYHHSKFLIYLGPLFKLKQQYEQICSTHYVNNLIRRKFSFTKSYQKGSRACFTPLLL